MRRCITCKGRIWPWQHYGYFVGMVSTTYWHSRRCYPKPLYGGFTDWTDD